MNWPLAAIALGYGAYLPHAYATGALYFYINPIYIIPTALPGVVLVLLGLISAIAPRQHRGARTHSVDPTDVHLRRQVVAYGRTGHVRLLSLPERDSHSPRFGHRTDRVVYPTAEAVGPPETRRFALETLQLSSGARHRLTEPPPTWTDDEPQWSPDDAWITFRRAPAGHPERGEIWIMAAEGGAARPLPVSAADARWLVGYSAGAGRPFGWWLPFAARCPRGRRR